MPISCFINFVRLDETNKVWVYKTSDHTLFCTIIFIKWHKRRIHDICIDLPEEFSIIHVHVYNLKWNIGNLQTSLNRWRNTEWSTVYGVTLQRLGYPRYSDLTKDKEPSACSDTESGEFASDLGETGNSKCCGIYRYGYFTCIVVVT